MSAVTSLRRPVLAQVISRRSSPRVCVTCLTLCQYFQRARYSVGLPDLVLPRWRPRSPSLSHHSASRAPSSITIITAAIPYPLQRRPFALSITRYPPLPPQLASLLPIRPSHGIKRTLPQAMDSGLTNRLIPLFSNNHFTSGKVCHSACLSVTPSHSLSFIHFHSPTDYFEENAT